MKNLIEQKLEQLVLKIRKCFPLQLIHRVTTKKVCTPCFVFLDKPLASKYTIVSMPLLFVRPAVVV